MKKTYIAALAMAAGLVGFSSCADQLDIPQKGVTPLEEFYQTDADAEAALAAAYIGFMENVVGRQPDMGGPGIYTPCKIITNMPGDDLLYASGNYGDHEFSGDINEFRYDTEAEVIRFQYSGIYQSIYTCNLVISNFGGDKANTQVKKQCVAEARGLRAYCYFLLANLWGNSPLVTEVLTGSALPTNCAETPEEGRKVLLNFVATECEEIAKVLPMRKDKSDKEGCVRVSKGFADALAGEAYLFLGEWAKAKASLWKVIESDKYALIPGEKWADNFHIEGDCSEEKVFEINFEYNAGVGGWGGMIQRSSWMEANAWNWRAGNFVINPAYKYCGIDGWGGLGVKQNFGDEFFANDGHSYRFDESLVSVHDAIFGHAMEYGILTKTYEKSKKDEQMKDYLSIESYWKTVSEEDGKVTVEIDLDAIPEEALCTSKGVGIKDPLDGLYGNSFWLQKKWLMRRNDTEGNKYGDNIRLNNYVIMRYAQVLLSYAEACVMAGKPEDGLKYIQDIQNRAGSKTKTTGTLDIETVKKERHYELFLENTRFFDIMRWNDANGIAEIKKNGTNVPHVYDEMYRPIQSTDKGVVKYGDGRLYTVSTQAAKDKGFEVGFKEGKHNFFPIPQTVIDKNPNIKQHANWPSGN